MSRPTLPVVEVFGPTVAGEGALVGRQTHFVRLGLCDFRCSWCDSMHAVDPEQVAANAERLTAEQVVERVRAIDRGRGTPWVSLSGGNPAIHAGAGELVERLRAAGFMVNVETQGSRWQPWLALCDMVTVSPKPPSAGMEGRADPDALRRILALPQANLKVVVFDAEDLAFAARTFRDHPAVEPWLSVGTRPDDSAGDLLARYLWLAESALEACAPEIALAGVLPQMHVLLWGHRQGV